MNEPRLEIPKPDWRLGCRAALLLGVAVAGMVGAFVQSGWGAPVQLVACVRLLFTLPPLAMFALVLALHASMPRLVAPMLALAMGGLTLWSAYEAASDLYKPVDLDEWLEVGFMSVTIIGIVGYLWSSLQEGRRLERQMLAAATRDALTGLLNREGFLRAYAGLGPGTPLTLVMLDLNGLKRINDLGGHSAGDAHLRAFAERLGALLPEGGAAARWGGDEFALLLPHVSADTALRTLEALDRPPLGGGPVCASGAVALRAGEPLQRALALADAHMYETKVRQYEGGSGDRQGGRAVGFETFAAEIERLEEPGALVQAAFALARRDLGFDAALYFRRTPAGFALADQAGALPAAFATLGTLRSPRAGMGLSGLAIEQGVSVWAEDYPSHPRALAQWAELGVKSFLAVPVHDEGRVVGLLNLLHFNHWQAVTPPARRAVQAVALRLGHVLERERLLGELRRSLEGGLLGLGIALEARDLETAGHTERVVALAERLGQALKLPDATLHALRQGAYLHDIGKLAVPDHVLLKPGKLSPDEWAVMRSHSAKGHEIARTMPGLGRATLEVIRHHHERWDGAGYPDGLVGETVPLAARVFAVCDVFDALTSARPYKRAWPRGEALAEIVAQSGRQFDPEVVDAFSEMMGVAPAAEEAVAVAA